MQLIAFAFGWPNEFEINQYRMPDKVRFARIEVGNRMRLTSGREVGPYYWRKWELPQEDADVMAKAIQEHIGTEVTGFTLFWSSARVDGKGNPVTPGFQMSIRTKADKGWSISRISETEANLIFDHLKYVPSPNGPWQLTDDARADIRDSFIVPTSAVEEWPARVKPPEPEYFESEGDLLSLLDAAAAAVGARTALTATLVAGRE